ncbi:MAG: DUF420 domain-containing protein [Verrucomicrobiota bacterium]
MTTADLPALNAFLNATSTVLLITGLVCIKNGKRKAHGGLMISALVVSTIFLACYVVHKLYHSTRPSDHMEPLVRGIYLTILIPHIILAIVNLPMIITTVIPAIRQNFEIHKRRARRTYPIWLFVSITGVLVYFFQYVWFPPY